MIRNLRLISVIEATSYLLLLIATVVKRSGGTELGVTIIGPIHGILFLVFAGMFLRDHRNLEWPTWKAIAAIIIGSLPFGGFWIDRNWLTQRSPGR